MIKMIEKESRWFIMISKQELKPEICASIGNIDLIAHLAAGSHVDRSIKLSIEFVKDNVLGTAHILIMQESAIILKDLHILVQMKFLVQPLGINYKENDRYNSTNPYSASKAGGEELVVAFENTYGLPSFITHTMNVFGERQNPEKYIPMVIKKVRDNELVTVIPIVKKLKQDLGIIFTQKMLQMHFYFYLIIITQHSNLI